MGKTPEKVTKDPKHVEAAGKGREKYMNKLKENILNDVKKCGDTTIQAMKLPTILPMQAMKLATLPTPPPPQDQMIIMLWRWYSCCPCHRRLCNFLRITKNKSAMNNLLNQNDVIYYGFDDEKTLYNKRVVLIGRKTLKTLLKLD